MSKAQKTKKEDLEPSWLKSYHEDNKRHLGALQEHFQHGVKAIGEQYFDLRKDIGEVKNTQKSHTEMIGGIMVDVETMKRDVEIIKSDIQIIKADVKKKVDYEDFSKLERRVAILETNRH